MIDDKRNACGVVSEVRTIYSNPKQLSLTSSYLSVLGCDEKATVTSIARSKIQVSSPKRGSIRTEASVAHVDTQCIRLFSSSVRSSLALTCAFIGGDPLGRDRPSCMSRNPGMAPLAPLSRGLSFPSATRDSPTGRPPFVDGLLRAISDAWCARMPVKQTITRMIPKKYLFRTSRTGLLIWKVVFDGRGKG